jgi:carboxypeptidase Taq
MQADAAYAEMIRRTREKSLLEGCMEVLAWDEGTYLPAAGAEHRAKQMALLAGLAHEKGTDPRLGELLAEVESSNLASDPESDAAVNVREIRQLYDWETCLPRPLVEESARVTALAEQEWAAARRRADFALFRPWLERVIGICREYAAAIDDESDPYDVLLHHYESELTTAQLTDLFDALRRELVPLVNALTHARRRPDVSFLTRRYAVDRQRKFGERVAAGVGFDFAAGRLDTTSHPFFSTLGPRDIRITTRFQPDRFRAGFFGVLHEVGHGLYEQSLPAEHHGTPLGESPSLALHESQARLWENAVGRSRGFWAHFLPTARDLFSTALRGLGLDDFYFAINHVEPTFIRASADEVTYNLHILIRFELERALIADDLRVADLPGAWADAYRRYLGITPDDDAEGCLQDGHWAAGMFGYFPVYTVGNLLAAQFFARARADLPDLDAAFARGDFGGLLDWLRAAIYRHGSRYTVEQLTERATGSPLHIRPFLDGLRHKYQDLYRRP